MEFIWRIIYFLKTARGKKNLLAVGDTAPSSWQTVVWPEMNWLPSSGAGPGNVYVYFWERQEGKHPWATEQMDKRIIKIQKKTKTSRRSPRF